MEGFSERNFKQLFRELLFEAEVKSVKEVNFIVLNA